MKTKTFTSYEKVAGMVSASFTETEGALSGPIILKLEGYAVKISRDEWDDLVAVVQTMHEALKGVK